MTEVVNGYHGGFKSDVNGTQLQKCSENEIKENFFLNQKASIKSDTATVNYEERQSNGPGIYNVDSMYGCDCELEKARDVQLSQPNINFNGGFGWMGENGCLIDNDSDLRKNTLTNLKYINQLDRVVNAGFYGKGPFDVDAESDIRDSRIVAEDRSCGPLSGSSTLKYSLTPMIEKLSKEVQNTKHIIPEDSINSWVRGGLPSRQIVRNKEYLKRLSEN
jgi:hypothetical protein